MFSRAAEVQVLLEGVPLPGSKQELIDYALRQSPDGWELALLEELPEQEYASLDEVGEALFPVQPTPRRQPREPRPESGDPPGREAYTDPAPEPGSVREA